PFGTFEKIGPPNTVEKIRSSGVGKRRSASGCRATVCDASARLRVMAQASGQVLTGLHDDRCELFLHALRREAIGGAADREAADHVPRIVLDGDGDGAHVLDVLARVEGEAVLDRGLQLLEQSRALGDRLAGKALQRLGELRLLLFL